MRVFFYEPHSRENLPGRGVYSRYVMTAFVSAAAAFVLGCTVPNALAVRAKGGEEAEQFHAAGSSEGRRRLLIGMAMLVGSALVKSNFAPMIFDDVEVDGSTSRTTELLIGLGFAVLGAACGSQATSPIQANILTCALVGVSFSAIRRIETADSTLNPMFETLLTKFVGSFCGAASGFASMLPDTELTMASASALLMNAVIALVFAAIYYTFDHEGLDACAYSLREYCA